MHIHLYVYNVNVSMNMLMYFILLCFVRRVREVEESVGTLEELTTQFWLIIDENMSGCIFGCTNLQCCVFIILSQ